MASRPETQRRASKHARWKAQREPSAPVPLECTPPLLSLNDLSLRQREILVLLAQGLDNDAVAERLFLAANTVKNHLTNIYQRLGVQNRTAAARVYWESQRGG